MRYSIQGFAIGLLAAHLALATNPQAPALTERAQYSTGVPDQTVHGRPLTDAPVPAAPPGASPVDRVAGPGSRSTAAGPVNATPFSGAPTSAQAAGSPATPNGVPGADATPNLGR